MDRRRFLAGTLAGMAALLFPAPIWAHHKPGHAGGPPDGKGPQPDAPDPVLDVTVDSSDVLVNDQLVLVAAA